MELFLVIDNTISNIFNKCIVGVMDIYYVLDYIQERINDFEDYILDDEDFIMPDFDELENELRNMPFGDDICIRLPGTDDYIDIIKVPVYKDQD